MSPSIGYGASGFQDLPHSVAGWRLLQMSLAGVAIRTLRTLHARVEVSRNSRHWAGFFGFSYTSTRARPSRAWAGRYYFPAR